MNKKVLTTIIIVVLVLAGALVIIHKKRVIKNLPPPENPPIPVVTATAKSGEVSDVVKTVALIESETAATVSAQVPGTLLEVRFHEGDHVRKGQVMARIDPRVLEDAVHSAKARLAAAEQNLKKQSAIFQRDKALYEGKAIAKQAFDVSAANFASAKAAEVSARKALASAQTKLSYAVVPAPYTGTVTARLVEPGDLAAPGKPLYRIQIPGAVKLLSKLSQDDLSRLRVGGKVTLSNAGKTMTATISRVYPALNRSHLGGIETDLKKAPFGLPSGSTLSAEYSATPERGLAVPNSALLEGLSETLVVRVKDGKADPVPVTIIHRGSDSTTVSGALKAGDIVVTGLPSELMALTAGTPVEAAGGRS